MVEYRDIAGYSGHYSVSNDGDVKSNQRDVVCSNGSIQRHLGRQLKKELSKGYLRVTLSSGNKQSRYLVHRLVASAFIPNPNGYKYVNHIDGDKLNNSVSNLEWCTASHNEIHSYKLLGKVNINRKLGAGDVAFILDSKDKVLDLANRFSVDVKTIYNIKNGTTYKAERLSVRNS